ncbi:MAG: polyprenyl synthetase family protein [Bacteroidetes bacterium]|nr:polyprenyl synthetase family protein [Bacteroidota bacterium]
MDYLKLIEKEIRKQRFGKEPATLYEPIRYIMSLGGKRLRPVLVLLAYNMYRSRPSGRSLKLKTSGNQTLQQIVSFAVAVEAFHNFTLMHDDIMDQAPIRRGKPTVHKKWGENTAILSGDVMLVKVYEMLSALEPELLHKALPIFNKTAVEVCEGQQLDMDFETRETVSEKEYLNMIRLKTAVLLGFSLAFGALLAGAPEQDQKLLYRFGVGIGTGFQLRDDILDVYANQDKFGKQVGGDIISNKKTYLLIKALELCKGKDLESLRYWLSAKKFNKKEKVLAVTALYDKVGIHTLASKKADAYFRESYALLKGLSSGVSIDDLTDYAKVLMSRQN